MICRFSFARSASKVSLDPTRPSIYLQSWQQHLHGASSIQSQRPSVRDEVPDAHTVSGERHVLADRSSGVPMALEDIGSCRVSAHLKALGISEITGWLT